MKILMATMGLDIGGAETHIVELAKQLKHQGHDIAIISNGGVYVPEITAAGIRHYEAPLHLRALGAMRKSRSILRQVIAAERPDVIHAHARIPAFLCGSLARSMKIPFVTSCHGVYQVSRLLKLLSDWGERSLAVSEDIRDYLVEHYHVPREHISLTINGIDTDKFSPRCSGTAVRREFGVGEEKVVCHVSRLDRETQLAAQLLIEIAPELAEKFPGIRILMVGGGTAFEELSARARQVNEALGSPCLILTGPRTDINELVAAGDVFVGVSRAALEAMAEEKPVILSGAQGHTGLFRPELLESAMDTNFCCRGLALPEAAVLLRDVTAALTLSAEEKKGLGEYGRQVIFDHYSVQRMAGDSLAMYDQVRRRKYNVVMSGYYGFANTGDDAILESVSKGVRSVSDEVELTVLSRDPELTRKQYGLNAVPRFNFVKVISALKKCDVLLSGGGSLLQDTTSTRSLLYYLSIMQLAKLLGKPVMLYANGIGPVRKAGNRKKVAKAVQGAALVTLRDHSSAKELQEMGVKNIALHVTADPVFRLESAPPACADALLAGTGIPAGAPFVAVSVRAWEAAKQFPEQLAALCDHMRRTYGLEILFLLMQPGVDRATTDRVREAMQEPSYLLEQPCSPGEMMAVLGRARLCLAMRLHTLIFAARMAVPTVGLVYDPKVASFLEELALPSAGHVEHFEIGTAITVCDQLMADYDAVLATLKEKSSAMTVAAGENEKMLLGLLEETKK